MGIVKGKPFDPTAFNALILPSLALMKSMSGQIDYGVGPKPERVKAIMQEAQLWEGKIAPKPNLIVNTIPTYFSTVNHVRFRMYRHISYRLYVTAEVRRNTFGSMPYNLANSDCW